MRCWYAAQFNHFSVHLSNSFVQIFVHEKESDVRLLGRVGTKHPNITA
jgi:hypothetical protein